MPTHHYDPAELARFDQMIAQGREALACYVEKYQEALRILGPEEALSAFAVGLMGTEQGKVVSLAVLAVAELARAGDSK